MWWACRCCSVAWPRGRTTLMRTVKSRGPDIPTLVSRSKGWTSPETDGGQKAGAPGRTRSSRSNHRAGNAGMSRLNLWYLPPAFFSAGGPWGRPAPGIPRALSLERAGPSAKLGRDQRCEMAKSCLTTASTTLTAVIASEEAIQGPARDSGLLRFARNDGEFADPTFADGMGACVRSDSAGGGGETCASHSAVIPDKPADAKRRRAQIRDPYAVQTMGRAVSAACPFQASRGMGPGVRRDDSVSWDGRRGRSLAPSLSSWARARRSEPSGGRPSERAAERCVRP
jgi:hypothetical protein